MEELSRGSPPVLPAGRRDVSKGEDDGHAAVAKADLDCFGRLRVAASVIEEAILDWHYAGIRSRNQKDIGLCRQRTIVAGRGRKPRHNHTHTN
jgi:hypothetical protein